MAEIKEILKEGTAIDFFKNLIANGEMEEDDLPIGVLKKEGRAVSYLRRYLQEQKLANNAELQAYTKLKIWKECCNAIKTSNSKIGECHIGDWCKALGEDMPEASELPEMPCTKEELELAEAWAEATRDSYISSVARHLLKGGNI